MFLVSESKLDHTFPIDQFRINVYKFFRLDRNRLGAELFLYMNEDIPCKPLQVHEHLPNCKVNAIEFYQIIKLYEPPNQKTSDLIQSLSLILDHFSLNIMTSHLLETIISPVMMFRSSHQRCSVKKVFKKISQNPQENTSVSVSF